MVLLLLSSSSSSSLSLVTGLFFLVLLLNQWWSPPLRLQVSYCSTFRIMCDVPSIAVFFSESIECFPGIASKIFHKHLVTIPVAPVITGIILHFRFHIHCISIPELLYFNFFSASFCTTFLSASIATSISACFLFFVFNYFIWPICCNFSLLLLLLLLLLFDSRLLVFRWQSFDKSRSQQEIKATCPSTSWMMCVVLINMIFFSSLADMWPGSNWRFWSNPP